VEFLETALQSIEFALLGLGTRIPPGQAFQMITDQGVESGASIHCNLSEVGCQLIAQCDGYSHTPTMIIGPVGTGRAFNRQERKEKLAAHAVLHDLCGYFASFAVKIFFGLRKCPAVTPSAEFES
jgi:hypothetical protein